MRRIALFAAVLFAAISLRAQDQSPEMLSVMQVVAGAQRTDTLYLHAMGKWSDSSEHLAVWSTEIDCYEHFGFCEEADATFSLGQAGVSMNSFDILRWDTREVIAVDSSPSCVVNTLRFDLLAKKVTITMALKGETKDPYCKDLKASTAFLGGAKDEIKKSMDHNK
jgi:hypothetical protein